MPFEPSNPPTNAASNPPTTYINPPTDTLYTPKRVRQAPAPEAAGPAIGRRMKSQVTMTEGEVATLLHVLRHVITSPDLSTWERKFCASMLARHNRGGFVPSAKRGHVLRRIVAAWKAKHMTIDLIDTDDKESSR